MVKKVNLHKTESLKVMAPGKTLGVLSVLFAVLSVLFSVFSVSLVTKILGNVLALIAIVLGIIYIAKTRRKALAITGIIIGAIGLVLSVSAIVLLSQNPNIQKSTVDPDTLKTQQEKLLTHFPESYTGFNQSSFETYYSGAIDLPFNGTKKQFSILLSYRSEYSNSRNHSAFKVWGEYIEPKQFNDYAIVMLNEMKAFAYPEASNNNPLSQPLMGQYNNHIYVYSYRNSTSYNELCDKCWFSSGKVFFPEENTVLTVTFFKQAGRTYSEAVSNTEKVLKEMIDLQSTHQI